MPSGKAALNQLRAAPGTWLQSNPLAIFAAGSTIKPTPYTISDDGSKWKLAPSTYGFGGDAFTAWHIPVDKANNVQFNSLQAVPVSRDGGADIVLTTQLTGCCFACAATRDLVFMQHVQPVGTTPQKLASDMAGGTFNGVGGVSMAFGSDGSAQGYDNAKNRVCILGLRKGRSWTLWAQIQGAAFNVLEVRKIWEG